jgi:hypothetical protein
MRIITPRFITEWRNLIKDKGFRSFIKAKGWKFVAAIVLFYLVRDTFLYIILPILVFNNVPSCY